MIQTPFITVEGPIGVGKTTLSKAISDHFHFAILKEIVDENPFLGKFYENIDEWSFQTEMFFLCNRYKQLEDIDTKFLAKQQPVVADYHIFKNLIFAQRSLKQSQYNKYLSVFDILTHDMPVPNMVIYLHASLDTLMNRIQKRGREIEKNISPLYLEQLMNDYHIFMKEFIAKHPDVTVLQFNGDEMDFVENDHDLQHILTQVNQVLQKGVKLK
ncbi:deoxynucleoside kinase [Bacillus testis]|uniref:deoxynucleoside kinase n=1 Tax=Bacillus testis TaxID=1622072 RepID=UPI00067EF1C6|nr:deoxynucleoside kinase [Bacillus testis]